MRKSEKKEEAGARKGREVAIHCVFPMVCGSGGSKSRLPEAADAEPFGQIKMKSCTPLWREEHFQVKMYQAHHFRSTFGSWDVEKVHAVVARSTFPSQNVQKHTILRHSQATFGSWDVEKVHAVVARSTFPSQNVQNTPFSDILKPLLEVEMSKKCTQLWREAHFQVKMYKAHHSQTFSGHLWKLRCRKSARSCGAKHISKSKCTKHTILRHSQATFGSWDVEKVHAVVARSTFPSQNVQSTPFSDILRPLWKLRCRKSARSCGAKHISKSKCTKHTILRHSPATFGSWDVEKVHAVVARSTFPSQNVQSTPFPEHFWKLRCRKSARSCGAKHISKSKCTKHTILRHSPATFGSWDVEKVHAVVARSTFPSQNVQSTPFPEHFWSWDVEKVHAVVARSTFPSQNVQSTPFSDILRPLLEVEMSKKCTQLWREAHFQIKMYKTHTILRHSQATLGSWDVEKVHAVVARSTFPSQNVQSTPFSDILRPPLEVEMSKKCTQLWREAHFQVKMYKTHHSQTFSGHFWKLRCRKSARSCGAKHISKSKCTKHTILRHSQATFGSWDVEKVHAVVARSTFPSQNVQNTPFSDILRPPLEVEMSKKCTQLWCEAHVQVKMYKTHHSQTFSGHFWKLRCRKSARSCGAKHISKSKCTKHTILRHSQATFGSWDVEKVHAVVARSTFPSQNVQSTPFSDILRPLLEVEMSKKCTQLWREAHFQVKMYKTHHSQTFSGHFWKLRCRKSARSCGAKHISKSKCTKHTILRHSPATFGSWDVEKVHAVVARSTFPSQNVQSTPFPEHFWKLRCRKSARSCGAKHISKSKCTKHTILRHSQATFGSWDVEKVHAVVVRSTFPSQNVQNTPFSDILRPLLEVEMSKKSARSCGAKHISKSKCTKHTILRHSQATFGSWDVEKVHAVVARSTFPSQNVQSTPFSDILRPPLEVEMSKKCTQLWREAHFQVKMYKAHHSETFSGHFWKLRCRKSARSCGAKHISKSKCTKHTILRHSQATFGSWDVEKVHAVVARSTFPSQNVQSTPFPEHFWKLRCRNSARSCGAKHISKSKCTKHTILRHSQATFGSWDVEKVHAVVARSTFPSQNVQNTPFSDILRPLLEVEMSKKCTQLWREAHFQVKMYKTHHSQTFSGHFWKLRCRKSARSCGAKHISKSKCTKHTILRHSQATFGSWDVEKVHAVVARSTFPSQNVQSTPFPEHFWKLRCRKSARSCGAKHISKSKCTKHTILRHSQATFGSWDVEKVHAVVARSTFPSQNVQNTPFSDILRPLLEVEMSKKCTQLWREAHVKMYKAHHSQTFSGHLWKLRCRKSARSCGAKHISTSKCTKHTILRHSQATFGSWDVEKVHAVVARSTFPSQNVQSTPFSDILRPLLEVEMSKKCTQLWCEAHFQVKSAKHGEVWTTFGWSDVGSRGRCKGLCTVSKVSKTGGFCSSFNYNHPYNTLQYTKLRYTTLHYTTLNYTTTTTTAAAPLHYITLHYTNYIQLHYTPLHSASFHPIPLHFATLQLQLRHLQLQPQLQLQLQYSYNYNYTTITTTALQLLTRATTSATPTTTLQLHHATLRYNTLH